MHEYYKTIINRQSYNYDTFDIFTERFSPIPHFHFKGFVAGIRYFQIEYLLNFLESSLIKKEHAGRF